ncbi:MAG TPA: TIGR02996 domain-containing protein [Gemmataceae bacterium]|nr:TIGR02996 domain-containing protein [Gemmataceae bacterium]
MTTEDALLLAVLADPDDDAPRLIYADWLDENGDGERAEFIRVQIALARTPEGRRPDQQLVLRERWLEKTHGARWAAALNGRVLNFAFRRGFVEEVVMDAPDFLTRGEEIFEAAPVRAVRLMRLSHFSPRLAVCHTLEHLAWLDIRFERLRPAHLAVLLASPHLRSLRALGLAGNNLGQSGLSVLTAAPILGSLTRLELWTNHLYNTGATQLAACPYLTGLKVLDLRVNGIGIEGGNALAAAPCLGNLELLDLRENFAASVTPALRERFGDRVRI